MTPWFITTTRSASVIASTWSCGDVDRGGAHLLVHLLDLDAHLHAQLGVEVGQRLVEQEHLGVAHDGAAHGDALALAAGELLGLAVEQLLDVEDAGCLVDALP